MIMSSAIHEHYANGYMGEQAFIRSMRATMNCEKKEKPTSQYDQGKGKFFLVRIFSQIDGDLFSWLSFLARDLIFPVRVTLSLDLCIWSTRGTLTPVLSEDVSGERLVK